MQLIPDSSGNSGTVAAAEIAMVAL